MTFFTPQKLGLAGCAVLLGLTATLLFGPIGSGDPCYGLTEKVCMSRAFEKALTRGDLEEAARLVAQLSSSDDPQSDTLCHEYMHEIGEKSFEFFEQGVELPASADLTECGFGFYHGLVEKIAEENSLDKAGAFCDYLKENSAVFSNGAELSCYHGLGHGSVVWHEDTFSVKEMISRGIRECDQLTEVEDNRVACGTGIFGGVGKAMAEEFKKSPGEVLGLCAPLRSTYAFSCATSLGQQLAQYSDYNLDKILSLSKEFGEDKLSLIAFEQALSGYGQKKFSEKDRVELIDFCQKGDLGKSYAAVCVQGYSAGLYHSRTADIAAEEMLKFCKMESLFPQNTQDCWKTFLFQAKQDLLKEKYDQLCNKIAVYAPGLRAECF